MIYFLEHSNIDKKKWDDTIQHSANGMVYAFSWYLDIVSPGWNALIEDDYQVVFPLTWRKKYSFQYLFQPFFTQQLGIFSAGKNNLQKKILEFLNAVPAHFRYIDIHLNVQNTFAPNFPKTFERLTHHLDLNKAYNQINVSYTENLTRNIKRSLKNKIELSSSIEAEEIIQLFRKNKGREINQLKEKDYHTLIRLVREADKRKLITLVGAKTPVGNWCAGAIFLKSHHEYIFFFSAANEEARASGAMSLLIDSFIQRHSNENMKLDFEGSMNKNLARFYKSFGSKEVVYLQVRKNTLPFYVRWMKR